jgi:hypothetical protein
VHIAFFAEQLYYLPQFLPVIAVLLSRGHRVTTVLRLDEQLAGLAIDIPRAAGDRHDVIPVAGCSEGYRSLRQLAPDWAVFGTFLDASESLAPRTRTALVYHGIGVKNVLFDARLNACDLRCVESQRVLDELTARDPAARARCALVGFAKLDPLINRPRVAPAAGEPPVLLYAPTFYPSSLERMPERLADLVPGARWLVKPHFFTWTVKQYAGQRKRLESWSREPGVEVFGPQTYNLVPLMARSDVLVSDASSALFEFAALGRPVVWCRFLKLRWTYRGPLAWRFHRRIDANTGRYHAVARTVDQPAQLPQALRSAIADSADPTRARTPEREALIEHLIGPRDGRASERIADELERR